MKNSLRIVRKYFLFFAPLLVLGYSGQERHVENHKRFVVTYLIDSNILGLSELMNKDFIKQDGMGDSEGTISHHSEILNDPRPIIIDAKLDDWIGRKPTIGLTDPWDLKRKDRTRFDYKITDGYFYFYFKTIDSTITLSSFSKESSVAEGDRVELFFSPKSDLSKYYCVEIGLEGDVLDYKAKYYRKFNDKWDFKSLEVAVSANDDQYIVEGRISLEELKSLKLIGEVYLGVFRADFQAPGKVNWYTKTIPDTKTPDFHIPSAFEMIEIKM